MNLRYLGDALDHWKGSLFESLQRAALLHHLAVDAMATDPEHWRLADFSLLAQLLRVQRRQIIDHRQTLADDRTGYFSEIEHEYDLFLDPDTGVATGKVRDKSQYLLPGEIHDLLSRQPDRVVAVYQHASRRKKIRDRLQEVVSALEQSGQPFSCCSYESGTVAMLFLSRNPERVNRIHQHFGDLLGEHARRRTHRW